MFRTLIVTLAVALLLLQGTAAEARNKQGVFVRGQLYLSCTERHILWDQLWIGIGPGKPLLNGCGYYKMTSIHGTRWNQVSTARRYFIGYFYSAENGRMYTCSRCAVGEEE